MRRHLWQYQSCAAQPPESRQQQRRSGWQQLCQEVPIKVYYRPRGEGGGETETDTEPDDFDKAPEVILPGDEPIDPSVEFDELSS